MNRLFATAAFGFGLAAFSSAADLDLSYSAVPDGSVWLYTMTLSVNTSNSGWTAGMGWDWLIFGDVASGTSPLADFTVTSGFPVGPWTGLSSSSGGNNGPTFVPVEVADWIPASAASTLTWQGTSAFNPTGQSLYFSELVADGGATEDSFKLMTPVASPEPFTMLAVGAPFFALIRKRRRKA